MISSEDIKREVLAILEGEETSDPTQPQYYSDEENIIPAINSAVKFVVMVVNAALGQKKITEEIFQDLTKTLVFRTSNLSRISISTLPGEVWTIRAVHPVIQTVATSAPAVVVTDTNKSYYRSDLKLSFIEKTADRLSIEEWALASVNPFKAGYFTSCPNLVDYAYLNPEKYELSEGSSAEIEIKPSIPTKDIAISFVSLPSRLTVIGTNDIELQHQLFPLLLSKTLNFIAMKQGDGQKSLYDVTSNDIATLARLIMS